MIIIEKTIRNAVVINVNISAFIAQTFDVASLQCTTVATLALHEACEYFLGVCGFLYQAAPTVIASIARTAPRNVPAANEKTNSFV